jgi:hypothetical protein
MRIETSYRPRAEIDDVRLDDVVLRQDHVERGEICQSAMPPNMFEERGVKTPNNDLMYR